MRKSAIVSATAFTRSRGDDPYAYRVNIDRTTRTLEFLRYNGGLRASTGTCARGVAPTEF